MPVYETVSTRDIIAPLTLAPLDKDLSNLAHVEYRTDRNGLSLSKEKNTDTLVLTYTGPAGLVIEKRLTFYNDTYKIDVSVITRGLDGYTLSLGTDFGLADKVSSDASGRVGLAAMVDGKVVTEKIEKIKGQTQYSGTIAWFGQEDKYFTATLLYGDRGIVTGKRKYRIGRIRRFVVHRFLREREGCFPDIRSLCRSQKFYPAQVTGTGP